MKKLLAQEIIEKLDSRWRLFACETVNGKNLRFWVGASFNGINVTLKFIVEYGAKHLYNDYDLDHAVECFNEQIDEQLGINKHILSVVTGHLKRSGEINECP